MRPFSGGGEAFADPENHIVVAREAIPESEGERVVAAMAIANTWLHNDTTAKLFAVQGYMLPMFAVDEASAPGQFGALARAARRGVDRRARGVGVLEIGDRSAVRKAESRFRRLAAGVNERPYALEIRRDDSMEKELAQVALTATVRFPRPFADTVHGIPNPFLEIGRIFPEVSRPDRHLLPV
ncbi:MAG: hypothetical protein Q4A37_01640 [Candidatus Saccharibacteria bacterium]|nr:hypothetical protein [Candidatus Saccharibacteria bacterium]